MPTTNLPNLISSLKDLLEVWRKTKNGGITVKEINHLMLRKYGTSHGGHIKLEFKIVRLVEEEHFDKHGAG